MLSPERIVQTAIELLDAKGEDGLTFRALAARLETGPGAIYWHIKDKDALLVAATDAIVARTLASLSPAANARLAIHGIALGMFDLIDAHPWVGTQLARAPWEAAMLRIFEHIGQAVEALGVRGHRQFTLAQTVSSYVIGVSIQNAAATQFARVALAPTTNRTDFLAAQAAQWKRLDREQYPFTRKVAEHLADHDDREEYLAGVDLILSGASNPAGTFGKTS